MSPPVEPSADRPFPKGPRSTIWAWILIGAGVLLLINSRFELSGGIFLLGIGAAFLAAYSSQRLYGFLVPGMILAGLGVGTIFDDIGVFGAGGEWDTFWLGMGFVGIYLADRLGPRQSNAWPLWPGGFLVLFGFWDIAWKIGLLDYEWWEFVEDWWPILLIVWGIYLLRRNQEGGSRAHPPAAVGGEPPPGQEPPTG
jgi:hypothetical protein